MAAPGHAKPIGEEGWFEPFVPKGRRVPPPVRCDGCGWRGVVTELLGVDPEEQQTLWCPRCGTSGWTYE